MTLILSILGAIALFLIAAGLVGLLYARSEAAAHPEPLWDWDALEPELDQVVFPAGFRWGAATAAHQVEGGHTANNWAMWEQDPGPDGKGRIQNGDVAGDAADHWNRYPEDIRRMRDELGLDTYRFSLSWSKLQPAAGEWDEDAIQHYHDVIDCCLEHGVEPMLSLHHFTHPSWFDALGSFERAENIPHVVAFTERVYQEYGEKVKLWCTFNEPGPFSVMGWGLGVFPPGKKSPRVLARVIRNLCAAHVQMVEAIRRQPGGQDAHVGLVKNIFQMDPWQRWNPLHWLLCRILDHVYNESILVFMKTGRVRLRIPLLMWVDEQIDGDRGDFAGLNYYANLLIDPLMKTEPPFEAHSRPGQIMTDMPYTIYAEGFWRALRRIGEVGLPVYVTENGIPDDRDDRRATWIRRYLYAMRKAMRDGVDVRGFYYWSLMDNFEWAEGYRMRFGLFAVDYETQERTLRAGAQPYIDTIRRSRGEEPA